MITPKTCIYVSLLFCSFLFTLSVPGQTPSQADLQKILRENQALLDKIKQDPRYKEAMKDQPAGGNGLINTSMDAGDYSNAGNWKFPPKNQQLLSSLPKKTLSKTGLLGFLNDICSQLSKKFAAGISSSVQSIAAKYKNDGKKMGEAAITGWYTGFREESLLLISKAAAANPGNGILLNNCAALLNMSGIEQKAIPILKYILQSYSADAMVLNNLGQAYAGLGETDTAMRYLKRCIKSEPTHPEANNTAGQIEAAKGNKQKATEYFKQSIKGSYTKTAHLKLKEISPDEKIAPLVKPRIKIPEYFNQFKYRLPKQCTSVDEAAVAEEEHRAFRDIISVQLKAYGTQLSALIQQSYTQYQSGRSNPGRRLEKDEFMLHPYYEFCGLMANEIWNSYTKELADIGGRVDPRYIKDRQALEDEYQGKWKLLKKAFDDRAEKCCGEGKGNCCPTEAEKCGAFNELANEYLPKFAYIAEEWQKKNQLVFTSYFDQLTYWEYLSLHPAGNDHFRKQYDVLIQQYLQMLGKIGITRTIRPCAFTPVKASHDSNALKAMDCPFEIEIPFIIGKFVANCDKISISGGEGAIFKYEKDLKTKQSTLSVGIGAGLELGKGIGPIKAGVSAGVSESFFISFDGNNKVSDMGLKYSAKAGGSIGAEAGGAVKGKGEIAGGEVEVGYTIGVNSGLNFNEGPFKGMVGPAPEVQVNKNINIYKSN